VKKAWKILFTVLYLLVPICLIRALKFVNNYHSGFFWASVAIVYFLTIIGLVLFIKYRPTIFPVPIIGLFFSPLWVFIYEYNLGSEYMRYLTTGLSVVYYALPFTSVSAVAYFIIKKKQKGSNIAT